jgi:hypothetical protein
MRKLLTESTEVEVVSGSGADPGDHDPISTDGGADDSED